MFKYKTTHVCKQSGARTGEFTTPHGVIKTPVFMPVGTKATVKALTPKELSEAGSQIILANTYHLYLRPTHTTVKNAGGLHKFMAWDKPILTDSGGFQIFSLNEMMKMNEQGVSFNSHIDGSRHTITPEYATQIQMDLGADIFMAFDHCTAYGTEYSKARDAVELTLRWLKRCYDTKKSEGTDKQMLFPIVQGNMYEDLRLDSLRRTLEFAECGIAIGGLSVGEPRDIMLKMLDAMQPHLPQDMPRYLMGVGSVDYLAEGVLRGIDMFDCVLPTRIARNGTAFSSRGKLTIRNAEFREDFSPLDESCDCYCCTSFSKAYLRHLINVDEILGGRMLSVHNITYLHRLMVRIREAINQDRYLDFISELRQSVEY